MKPLFRITMSMACLALLLWGGIAVPAETPPAPESCEYLMTVVEGYSCPESCEYLMTVVEGYSCPESCEYLMKVVQAAPWPLPASLAEAEGDWIIPTETMVAGVKPAETGSFEYSFAMETGNLPSACADVPCTTEAFTLIEAGGVVYRLEVDAGGN